MASDFINALCRGCSKWVQVRTSNWMCARCEQAAYEAEHTVEKVCEKCHSPFRVTKNTPDELRYRRCGICRLFVRTCAYCKATFDSEKPQKFCSKKCFRAQMERDIADQADRWWQTVDPLWRDTDVAKLPRPQQSKYLLEWEWGPLGLGLIIYGPTGTGKTRTLYLLLRCLAYRDFSVKLIRGLDFQAQVIDRTRPNGPGGFQKWFAGLLDVDILAVDDCDKIKFSPRVESEFFNLIDQRTSCYRVLMLSSNSTGSELLARLSPENGPAIVRRIAEFCEPVNFGPVTP